MVHLMRSIAGLLARADIHAPYLLTGIVWRGAA